MDVRATKTHQERQDEEAERLVRPSPKYKPPRRDLRRERVETERDPDKGDESDGKDRSKNYKNVGGSAARLVRRMREAAKDERIPAKSRETGETVMISPDTLKEKPGEYEPIDQEEAKPKPKPEKPEKAEPKEPKPSKEPLSKEEFYGKAGDALHTLAKSDPKLESRLKNMADPNSQLAGMAKENPELPAAQFFAGYKLPEGINTLGDVAQALQHAGKAKPQKSKKPVSKPAPKEEPAPPKAEPSKDEGEAESESEPEEAEEKPEPDEDSETEEGGEPEEPTAAEKAGIAPPKRRAVNSAEREEAVNLIVDTFPEDVAVNLLSKDLHPDDVRTLVKDYTAAKAGVKVKDPAELAAKVTSFYQTDPAKVSPPTVGRNAKGERVSFDKMTPEEQSESTRQHQLRTVALSLAAHEALTDKFMDKRSIMKTPRVPKPLASHMASLMLSRIPSDEADRVAADTFDTTLKSGAISNISEASAKRLLEQVRNHPVAKAAAKAYLQANDYSEAKQKFLKGSDDDGITEWQNPKDIIRGLRKAGKFFDQKNAMYGDTATHPASTLFRLRLLSRLRALDPKKAREVTAALPDLEREEYEDQLKTWKSKTQEWESKKSEHEKAVEAYTQDPTGKEPPGEFAEEEPQRPIPPNHHQDAQSGEDIWKAAFEPEPLESEEGQDTKEPPEEPSPEDKEAADKAAQAAASAWEKQAADGTSIYPPLEVMKTGVYHGIDPYAYGPAGYPGWLQPHQRDFGTSDYDEILKSAKQWLSSPLLSVAVDGMPKDAQFRAALDLAIYGGPYNGAVTANTYNELLAKLAGVSAPGFGETLTTLKSASYETARMDLLIYGGVFDDAAREALQKASFAFNDTSGVEHQDGRAAILSVKAGRLPQPQEGLVPETLVLVDFPGGAQEAAFKAVQAALLPLRLRVSSAYTGYEPKPRKLTADDTFTFSPTPNDSSGGRKPMKASHEVRKLAAEAASKNPKLAFDMLALADRLAEEEKKGLPPWLKDKVEDKADKKDEEEKKEAGKYASLRSLVIKQASTVDPTSRAPWLPILQALKDLG